jgi:hypothetical protein
VLHIAPRVSKGAHSQKITQNTQEQTEKKKRKKNGKTSQ